MKQYIFATFFLLFLNSFTEGFTANLLDGSTDILSSINAKQLCSSQNSDNEMLDSICRAFKCVCEWEAQNYLDALRKPIDAVCISHRMIYENYETNQISRK